MMMHTGASPYDLDRFGGVIFRSRSYHSDLLNRMAPSFLFRKFGDPLSTTSTFCPKVRVRLENQRPRSFRVKASGTSGRNQSSIAPLTLESPSGQLLSQIMLTHPHLLPAAIDQQLEMLQAERETLKNEKPDASMDLLLYRRIADVKEKDRQKSLEEIIYCLVVQKFMEGDISMISPLSPSSDSTMQVYSWTNQERKLENVHSADARDLIHSHLTIIVGERAVGPLSSVMQISKIKLGKLYAASIMYGYFLKRVDQRFQLERSMGTLPPRIRDNPAILEELKPNPFWDMESMVQISPDGEEFGKDEEGEGHRLRFYVMFLDADTLQRYATMRSKETVSLIEKQTQALFGKPDAQLTNEGSIDISNDEIINVTISGMTMLILEAAAFGSFLWDAESYVESKYQFLNC